MKIKKKISIVSISMFTLFSIASCTPPIPPDVLASFAEKDVQCASDHKRLKKRHKRYKKQKNKAKRCKKNTTN